MESIIGTIMAVGFDYAPNGWALCNGQLLSIQGNAALFTLLGTAYGGDGRTTFGLPDLRGRTIVGSQATPKTGVTAVARGEKVGQQNVSVTSTASSAVPITVTNLPGAATGTAQISGLNATSILHATTNGPGPTTPAPGSTAPSAGAYLSSTGAGQSGAAIYYTNPSPSTPLPTVPLSDASVKTVIGGTAAFAGTQIGIASPQPLAVTTVMTTAMSVMQPTLGLTYIICTSGIFPQRS